jgi:hypothetical protein
MFDLYFLPRYPVPFPRENLGTFTDLKELVKFLDFTATEIDALFDGKIVREKYCLELSPYIVRRFIIDELVRDNPDGYSKSDIAFINNESEHSVEKRYTRAINKMRAKVTEEQLLNDSLRYRKRRAGVVTHSSRSITRN